MKRRKKQTKTRFILVIQSMDDGANSTGELASVEQAAIRVKRPEFFQTTRPQIVCRNVLRWKIQVLSGVFYNL